MASGRGYFDASEIEMRNSMGFASFADMLSDQ